jgi:hypothetical protein
MAVCVQKSLRAPSRSPQTQALYRDHAVPCKLICSVPGFKPNDLDRNRLSLMSVPTMPRLSGGSTPSFKFCRQLRLFPRPTTSHTPKHHPKARTTTRLGREASGLSTQPKLFLFSWSRGLSRIRISTCISAPYPVQRKLPTSAAQNKAQHASEATRQPLLALRLLSPPLTMAL